MVKFSVTRLYSDKDDESNQEPFFDRGERTKGRPLVEKRKCSKSSLHPRSALASISAASLSISAFVRAFVLLTRTGNSF